MVKDLLRTLKALAGKRRELSLIDVGKHDPDYAEAMSRVVDFRDLYEDMELKPEDKDKFLIEIDPGISFGTGKHETTQLCIRQLSKYIKEYKKDAPVKVLDVGCGSGILSIVALKLGADFVLGTDLDENCITSTRENMEINHLPAESGNFYVGNLIDDGELQSKVGTSDIEGWYKSF